MKLGALVVIVGVAGIGACSKDPPAHGGGGNSPARAPLGTERGDCRPAPTGSASAPPAEAPVANEQATGGSGSGFAPPDDRNGHAAPVIASDEPASGSCDPGLVCLSNLCVRPPPADCQAIADQLTSFELGNYAEPDERAPHVAKLKAACNKALVSKEQGECIAKTTDKYSAYQCAPLMFPELAAGGSDDCQKIATAMRASLMASLNNSADPQLTSMMENIMGAMRASCDEDGWPVPLKQCILAAGADMSTMNRCEAHTTPEIQQKLAARIAKLQQQMTQQQPTPGLPTPPPPPPAP